MRTPKDRQRSHRTKISVNMIDVTIIIVNWNTKDLLHNCLKSIDEQAGAIEYEVIVIDNASTDGSAAMVRSQFPNARVISNDTNRGFAAANNQGMAIAQGRYVLLLNSDTIVLNNAIEKTVDFADTTHDTAVIGCRVLNPDRSLQPTCFMYPSILNMILSSSYLYKLFPNNRFFGRERMTWWGRSDVREVDVVTGCFMLVRREAIKQAGMMDEDFFMYGEETDWCYRFKKTGWKNIFMPDAEIIHLGGQSSRKIAVEMSLQLRGSILYFIGKHKSRLEYVLACFLVWLFFVVRIPIWFLKYLLSIKKRKYNYQRMMICVKGVCRITVGGGKSLCTQINW